MSDKKPDRRHANVVNIDEINVEEHLTGRRFGGKHRQLGEPAGARAIGCSWYEIPPGRSAYPYHFHCINEEAMYVLEGEGTLRIGPDKVPIKAGDWVSFPVGPATAHQVTNSGTSPLRFLGMSTKVNGDIVGYPDSKKIGASGRQPGSGFGQPAWVRILVPEGTSVDYFQGEDVG